MKAWPQREQRETAALIERAQRALRQSQNLLEQREAQLSQLEQLLEHNPEIAHKKQFLGEWMKSEREHVANWLSNNGRGGNRLKKF